MIVRLKRVFADRSIILEDVFGGQEWTVREGDYVEVVQRVDIKPVEFPEKFGARLADLKPPARRKSG